MEYPTIQKSYTKNQKSLAIVYPNLYYGGVYCLAPLIFYNLVNKEKNWKCDRKFLDKQEKLGDYNLVGFTFQYELDIKNIKQIIKKLKSKMPNAKCQMPILFAGGPVSNINPNILKNIVDFQILGEIEETLPKILKIYEINQEKNKFLEAIKNIPGVFTSKTSQITYAVNNLSQATCQNYPIYQPLPKILNKNFVFGNSFLLEIERGCSFKCKFCPMPQMHPKPTYYKLQEIKKIIDKGLKINKRNKVIIYSASFTHPEKKEILKYLIKKGVNASIPSTKIETMDLETLKLIKELGQKTITIAPEANQRLRKTLNKHITDKEIMDFLKQASHLNFEKVKVYFLLGLPNQMMYDLEQTISLINEMKKEFRNLYISFNPFVPKPRTAFEKEEFQKQEIKKQVQYIKKHLKNTKYKISSVSTSEKEYKISRT